MSLLMFSAGRSRSTADILLRFGCHCSIFLGDSGSRKVEAVHHCQEELDFSTVECCLFVSSDLQEEVMVTGVGQAFSLSSESALLLILS